MKYDVSNVIGRFQLPHEAHIDMIKHAASLSHLTIVSIGSSNLRRSLRNPFNFYERAMLIENSCPSIKQLVKDRKIIFCPLEDSIHSDAWWVEHVQRQVTKYAYQGLAVLRNHSKLDYKIHPAKLNICLVGHKKDNTSYYLDMFPEWTFEPFESKSIISATEVRNLYFEEGLEGKTFSTNLNLFTTAGVKDALKYITSQVYNELKARHEFIKEYKKQWGEGPFYTADAMVIKSGHLLLITRGGEPDKGSWAFPGGFVNKNEDGISASKRELLEETGLDLTRVEYAPLHHGYYDDDYRDDRGKICTNAYLYDLGIGELPKVKGMDDADGAEWVPFADLMPQNMALDHYFIFRDLIRRL